MKTVKLFILFLIMAMNISCQEDKRDPKAEVEEAVEAFRETMVHPDQATFERLTSPILTYGHSNGLVEDRETCIASMVTGKYKFLTLALTDQTIAIEGNIAVVRHVFSADTHDEGKEPGTVKLKVLQVWREEGGTWRLLARQAVKI